MLTKNLSVQSLGRAGGLALVAAVAIGMAQPSVAAAAQAHAQSVTQPTRVASTDISAARRHRQARHSAPRDAYGSYVGGTDGVTTQSYPGYGYGYGDNSRNQTW